jgi:hypothetical protein
MDGKTAGRGSVDPGEVPGEPTARKSAAAGELRGEWTLAGAPDHVSSRCISFLYFLDFSFFLNFQNLVKTLGFQSFCIICCQFFSNLWINVFEKFLLEFFVPKFSLINFVLNISGKTFFLHSKQFSNFFLINILSAYFC